MKNIKYITILVVLFSLGQLAHGQSALDNGRTIHSTPKPTTKTQTSKTVAKDVPSTGTYVVDLDVPGTQRNVNQEKAKDISYPIDLEIMKDELMAGTSSEMVEKVEGITTLVDDLLRVTEELRLENKVIRESLNNCCSNNTLGLSANDAYLLQNAPNPFNETTEIRYFVPGGIEGAEIHIRDIKGSVLNAIKVSETGFGKVLVDSTNFGNGSFIYTLSVKNEIIDSKVMIVTK